MDITLTYSNFINKDHYARMRKLGAFNCAVPAGNINHLLTVATALDWVRAVHPDWGLSPEFGIEEDCVRGYWGMLYINNEVRSTELKDTYREAETALLDLCLDELEKERNIYAYN